MATDAAFGQAAKFTSDVGFNLAVSDDKKAFTASFSGLEVVLEGKSAPPIATRVFSFTIPLSGTDAWQEIPFAVQGFVASEKEASAHLVFTVNNQSTVMDFPANSNTSFMQQLKYKPEDGAAETRITVFLLADRDSTSDSAVHVNVSTIDTDMAVAAIKKAS